MIILKVTSVFEQNPLYFMIKNRPRKKWRESAMTWWYTWQRIKKNGKSLHEKIEFLNTKTTNNNNNNRNNDTMKESLEKH